MCAENKQNKIYRRNGTSRDHEKKHATNITNEGARFGAQKFNTHKFLVGYFDESISDNSERVIVYRRVPRPAPGVGRDY